MLHRSLHKHSRRLIPWHKWCSVCDDFSGTLVLCAGCRVGVCTANNGGLSGCLAGSVELEDDNLIYYCRFCSEAGAVSDFDVGIVTFQRVIGRVAYHIRQLKERNEDWPDKQDVLFRCDPGVIVVSMNWHEKQMEIGESIHHHMAMKYTDHEDRVRIYQSNYPSLTSPTGPVCSGQT